MGTHSENHDAGDAGYREILAEFCTTSKKIDTEKGLAGYYFQIDGLDENLEFSWTQAKGYEQISDMEGAVRHEDRWMVPRAVPAGEKGLAVELYAFSENISEQLIPGRINAGVHIYADDGCFRVVQAVTAQAAGGKEQETGKGYRPFHSARHRLSLLTDVYIWY